MNGGQLEDIGMNDNQLERNLRSVGKECFVTYFKQFNNLLLSNQDIAEHIHQDRGYTWKACQSRTSHARSIIREGQARDALENISASDRVRDQRIRDKPESTEGGRRVSVLKRQEGAPVLLG